MDAVATLQVALKQYQAHKEASKRSYDKKMGPKESRRPPGRPRGSKNMPKLEIEQNPEIVAEGGCCVIPI